MQNGTKIGGDDLQVAILAGGLGTRLRPLVDHQPKPMADLNGRPFLEYLIHEFDNKGFNRFLFLVGYLWERIYNYFGSGDSFGVQIRYSVEEIPLGTAGAVRLALPMLEKTFILVNGDTLVSFPGSDIIENHFKKGAGMTVMLTNAHEDSKDCGNMSLEPVSGRVSSYQEKTGHVAAGNSYVNAGIYICQREIFEKLPQGQRVSLENDVLPQLVDSGSLYGYKTKEKFIDIGTPERLLKIRKIFGGWVHD